MVSDKIQERTELYEQQVVAEIAGRNRLGKNRITDFQAASHLYNVAS
jgi:hypothetical protein